MMWIKRRLKVVVFTLVIIYIFLLQSNPDNDFILEVLPKQANLQSYHSYTSCYDEIVVDSNIQWDSKIVQRFSEQEACLKLFVERNLVESTDLYQEFSIKLTSEIKRKVPTLFHFNQTLDIDPLAKKRPLKFVVFEENARNQFKEMGVKVFNHLNIQELKDVDFVFITDPSVAYRRIPLFLAFGAIPVLINISTPFNSLPFGEVLDWSKIVYRANGRPFTDLINSTKWTNAFERLEKRRQGWLVWNTYFSSMSKILDAYVAINIQNDLGIPSLVFKDFSKFGTPSPIIQDPILNPEGDYFYWNIAFNPFVRAPIVPPMLQSNRGSKEIPKARKKRFLERFTPIVMTYKRHHLLEKALGMFKNITQHIDQVIIVWNDPRSKPDAELQNKLRVSINAKIQFIFPPKNSLHNRYLPLDSIQTRAIFLFDDDTRRLSGLSVLDGFRAWQENRDRLVGFVGRDVNEYFYPEMGKWHYIIEMHCESSILLPMALFIDRFFLYHYTYNLPPTLKEFVDKEFNCDDIFLNAMVQDLTGKPGLMASFFKDYSCDEDVCNLDASNSISKRDNHVNIRDQCLDLVYKTYGYMPLHSGRYHLQTLERSFCPQINSKERDYGQYCYEK